MGAWRMNSEAAQRRAPMESIHVAAPSAVVRAVASRSHADARTTELLARIPRRELVPAGSSLKFCMVAEGGADIYPRLGPTMEWDTAAAQCVLEAAGGKVMTLDGSTLDYRKEGWRNPEFVAAGGWRPEYDALIGQPN
jgi:3'(2'), 5'-bisphosphate nucleotidase